MSSLSNQIPKGYELGKLQQFSPAQMNLFNQLFSQVGPESYLSQLAGGDPSFYDQLEAPARREFGQQQANIASRFSGMGLGGQRSSGFQQAQTAAASDFSQQLASQRQQLQRQAIMDLFGLSNQLLGQNPYEQFLVQKQYDNKPNFLQQLIGGAAPVAGAGLGLLFGGPGGALVGGGIGSQFGQAFQ